MKKTVAFSLMLILLVSCLASCNFFKHDRLDNTTEHTHQWQDVSGEHARICVGCNEKQLKPEACDWQFVGQTSDCWSTTVTQACSKCGMEQFLHGDSVLPYHSWAEETANGKTTFRCTRCAESITFVNEIREFDYQNVLAQYKIGDPGVKHENFKNPEVEREDMSAIDAIIRAKSPLNTIQSPSPKIRIRICGV